MHGEVGDQDERARLTDLDAAVPVIGDLLPAQDRHPQHGAPFS